MGKRLGWRYQRWKCRKELVFLTSSFLYFQGSGRPRKMGTMPPDGISYLSEVNLVSQPSKERVRWFCHLSGFGVRQQDSGKFLAMSLTKPEDQEGDEERMSDRSHPHGALEQCFWGMDFQVTITFDEEQSDRVVFWSTQLWIQSVLKTFRAEQMDSNNLLIWW